MSFQAVRWALTEAPVTNTADAFVLVALAHHSHDDGTHAFPSTATLAKETRLARSTVFTALSRLKDLGLIAPEGEGSRGIVSYRLVMPQGPAEDAATTYPGAGYVGSRPIQQPDPPIQIPDTPPIQQPDPNNQEENSQGTERPPLPPLRGVTPLRWASDGGGARNGRPRRRLSRADQAAERAAELRARAAALRAQQAAAGAEREGPPADPNLHRAVAIIPAALEASPPRPSVRPVPSPPPEVRRCWKPEELQAIQERVRAEYEASKESTTRSSS
jgi:hypothetical protein